MDAATTTPSTSTTSITAASAEVTRDVRRSALVAGLALLVMAVLAGAAQLGVLERLVTEGDAAATAAQIAGSAGLFRLAIVAFVVVIALDVVVAWALQRFFDPVDHGLSMLAAWLRVGYAVVFAAGLGQLPAVPGLVGEQPTEALLRVDTFQDVWQMGLALFGLHLLLVGYLAYRCGYVPRLVAVLVVFAGGGYLVDSLTHVLVGNGAVTLTSVTFVGEVVLLGWLLIRGRKVRS